jgi:hypothetical protein
MESMTIRHSGVKTALVLLLLTFSAWTAAAAAVMAARKKQATRRQQADNEAMARMIVQNADEVRFPADGFQVDVTITTTDTGGQPTCAGIECYRRATPTAW